MPHSGKSQEIYEWCEKIIRTCQKTGKKYMMGETSYYRPEVQYAMMRHKKGDFGNIWLIEAEYLQQRTSLMELLLSWMGDVARQQAGAEHLDLPKFQEATAALARLQHAAVSHGNVFAELVNTVRVCSLGQITNALFDVGGQYRRSM
jgi:hypothetical protein